MINFAGCKNYLSMKIIFTMEIEKKRLMEKLYLHSDMVQTLENKNRLYIIISTVHFKTVNNSKKLKYELNVQQYYAIKIIYDIGNINIRCSDLEIHVYLFIVYTLYNYFSEKVLF